MRTLENILRKLEGKLLSIERNTESGRYEMKIGLPSNWIFEENNDVEVDILTETENAVLLKLIPANDDIVIDDLIDYMNIVIDINEEIAKKEEEFNKRMEERKNELKAEAEMFFDQLEQLKRQKFKLVGDENNEEVNEKAKKRGRPKIEPDYMDDKSSKKEIKEEDDSKLIDKLSK